MGKLKKIGIIAGLAVGGFFVILFAVGAYLVSSGNYNTSSTESRTELSKDEIKATAVNDLTYDELMRHNESYIGKMVHYKGTVLQVHNIYGNNYQLVIDISKSFMGGDMVHLNYEGERFLEDDRVEFYGIVKGLIDYETIFGGTTTIPEINAEILELVKKS